MATPKEQPTVLRGRFRPGDVVTLVKVDGPHVLHSGQGEAIERKQVPEDGELEFMLEVGARYLAEGFVDGQPVSVRLTGRVAGDPEGGVVSQPPVGNDPVKQADGTPIVHVPVDPIDLEPKKPKKPAAKKSARKG